MKLTRQHPLPPPDKASQRLIEGFRSPTSALMAEPEPLAARRLLQITAGALILGLVLASQVKIERTVTGQGRVVTHEPALVMGAMDSAIITALPVHEGDRVHKGDLLATLDPTFATADVDQLEVQLESMKAEVGRLEAERDEHPIASGTLPARFEAGEQALWAQRQAQRDEQMRGFDAHIAQYQSTIQKLTADTARYAERLKVEGEIEDMRHTLMDMQTGSKLVYLQAVDQRLEMLRYVDFETNALAEARHQLDATRADREAALRQWQTQVETDLLQRRTTRDAASAQLAKATKHQELVALRAPTDATVLSVAKVSVGSVLKDATPLVTLMPTSAPLEVEMQIDARDVGYIRPGDAVALKIEAFNYLEHGWAEGHLRTVSEDAFTVDQDNKPARPYYKGFASLENTDLHNVAPGFRLIPGMTVTSDIKVGSRTLMSYMVRGALRRFGEAMREP